MLSMHSVHIKTSKLKAMLVLVILHIILLGTVIFIGSIGIYFSIISYEMIAKIMMWIVLMFFVGFYFTLTKFETVIIIDNNRFNMSKRLEELYDFSVSNISKIEVKDYYIYKTITINYFNESIVLYSFDFYKKDFKKLLEVLEEIKIY